MLDVFVSYYSGQFGDWLRYFIAEHDGFEKFTGVNNKIDQRQMGYYSDTMKVFNLGNLTKDSKLLNIEKMNTIDELNSQIQKHNLRQVYKLKNQGMSHSIAYNPESYGNDHSQQWKYYNVIRQSNMQILFVKLNPLSELFETYVKRKILHTKANILTEEKLRYSCSMDYIHNSYPQHELNHEVEINNLAEYDEEEYEKLTTFLKVSPRKNWKSYAKELDKIKL